MSEDQSPTTDETGENSEETDSRPKTTPPDHFEDIPDHGEVVSKEVIDDSFDGKRRVQKVTYRVIADPDHITYIHDGDQLVRRSGNSQVQHEIQEVGPNSSRCDGMHVKLLNVNKTIRMNPIHLNLIRKWIDRGDAVIYGKRWSESSEIEGVDYDA